jgi:predicted nucleic acid-binding Zn ribbon protein
MELSGKLLRKLKLPAGCQPSSEDLVRIAWERACGAPIARHSRVAAVRGTTLVVEVDDPLWQHNLRLFEGPILRNLAGMIGPDLVRSMRVELGVPRIEPRRAHPPDEADGIRDPALRRVYRDSRRG